MLVERDQPGNVLEELESPGSQVEIYKGYLLSSKLNFPPPLHLKILFLLNSPEFYIKRLEKLSRFQRLSSLFILNSSDNILSCSTTEICLPLKFLLKSGSGYIYVLLVQQFRY